MMRSSFQQNAEKYFGDRSKESLTKFAMQFVKSRVTELWQGKHKLKSFYVYMCMLSRCQTLYLYISTVSVLLADAR